MTGTTNRHLYTVSSDFSNSTDPYSISVWINAVWNGSNTLSFVGVYDGNISSGTTTGLQIGTRTGTGEVSCWTYGGTVLVQSANNVMTAYNNNWAMITYTYDGVTSKVYRNNTLLGTDNVAQIPGKFTQVYINGYPPGGTTSETGTYSIDTYSYYGRTLSQAEIETIYNATGARHGIVDNLLARYDFDEFAEGTTVTDVVDVSGNNNNLINNGTGTAIIYSYINVISNSNLRPVQ